MAKKTILTTSSNKEEPKKEIKKQENKVENKKKILITNNNSKKEIKAKNTIETKKDEVPKKTESEVSNLNSNSETEMKIIGAMILDTELAVEVLEVLKTEDFNEEKNSILFETISKMIEQEKMIDAVSLKNQLETDGNLEIIGGLEYIAKTTDYGISFVNIEELLELNPNLKLKNKKENNFEKETEELIKKMQQNMEKLIVGIIVNPLISEIPITEVLDTINSIDSSSFKEERNEIIFNEAKKLYLKDNFSLDNLIEEIDFNSQLDLVAGKEYLEELGKFIEKLFDSEYEINDFEQLIALMLSQGINEENSIVGIEEMIEETLEEEMNKIEKDINKRIFGKEEEKDEEKDEEKETKSKKTSVNINDKSVLNKEEIGIKTTSKKTLDTSNQKVKEEVANEDFFQWDRDFLIIDEENGIIDFDKEKMIDITDENYYSPEANFQFMNSTQYGNWLECEAQEKAAQSGDYERPDKRAFILGNYVHSWNDGTMEEYCRRYSDELFKTNGEPYADTQKCDAIIKTFEKDDYIMFLLRNKTSEKEIIAVAKFAGVWWKVRIDDWNLSKKRIIDVKTSGGIHKKYWDNESRQYVNFVENYNYMRQMAIYQKIVRIFYGIKEPLNDVLLVVGEKDYNPDKMVINVKDQDRFEYELAKIEEKMERILKVKYGLEEPNRCETCDYCKQTKQLTRSVFYKDIKIN